MVALFVILTIVAFIAADSLVQWNEAKKEKEARQPVMPPTGSLIPAFAFEEVSVPGGVFVDAGHTWVSLDAVGRARVGLDDFIHRAVGRIDEIELPEVGHEIRRGEKLLAIHQGDREAVFAAPIDGVISSVNERLAQHPEAIKTDPYTQGWICSVKPKNLAASLRRLFIAEETMAWLNREIRRFQEFVAARPIQNMALGQVLQDGGQLTDGVLELMDEETWHLFTSEFLGRPTPDEEVVSSK
jgi:glycine cleavage system H protein